MGLFGKIFGGSTRRVASSVSFLQTYSGGSGGWGLERFNSIIDAHSSPDELVDEFGLDQPDCDYSDCYEQAYQEAYQRAVAEAAILSFLFDVEPEDLIDEDEVEENAYRYAIELVERWLDGDEWIPEDIMDYAWYELSDHNN